MYSPLVPMMLSGNSTLPRPVDAERVQELVDDHATMLGRVEVIGNRLRRRMYGALRCWSSTTPPRLPSSMILGGNAARFHSVLGSTGAYVDRGKGIKDFDGVEQGAEDSSVARRRQFGVPMSTPIHPHAVARRAHEVADSVLAVQTWAPDPRRIGASPRGREPVSYSA